MIISSPFFLFFFSQKKGKGKSKRMKNKRSKNKQNIKITCLPGRFHKKRSSIVSIYSAWLLLQIMPLLIVDRFQESHSVGGLGLVSWVKFKILLLRHLYMVLSKLSWLKAIDWSRCKVLKYKVCSRQTVLRILGWFRVWDPVSVLNCV